MDAIVSQVPWAPLLIVLPLAAAIASFLLPSFARTLGLSLSLAYALAVIGLGWQLVDRGSTRYPVGGWGAPLGIDLYADGLSLLMLGTTAVVGAGITLYASAYFKGAYAARFWPQWHFLLTALSALFLSGDLFNIYVSLELIGLPAVALTALQGDREALTGAMRYLLAALLGSLVYLSGVALLYHSYGTVDIALLSERVASSPVTWAAFGLLIAGLMLKTALFPLHFWLPPAHASAPAPVSALLSALVVKASLYVIVRLWLEMISGISGGLAVVFGVLGAGAILWGSAQALRQERLKLLIAYSTVAQIGYMFLAFPLAAAAGVTAWNALACLILSHALAKAAMFLAAGNLMKVGGHDRIADLDRVVQRLPLSVGAFALAGVSIMGLPPSGGFIGKWLLLQAAVSQALWAYVVVIIIGGVLAAGYVFKVLGHAFTRGEEPGEVATVPATMEWAAMLLASGAILMGFLALPLLELVGTGHLFKGGG
ncbi:NADH/Ubiquinone/plastoquinone (complex I) [Rhodomicrobium vannielii ATCC 17100]|jgi:multicomponent Na+:H+ antiporter subunit D|uniref:NADH/Ubiquinone/plastoquinone (Complex I) n=1 Tax=Rhodomicrobium vannielii (strain ATCC 17100 / DSM 162 / LMG 4299 / NCIMB 10020 / ATH 3.1.1) TaxID=648757 RepID=E3I3L5_RHOVT|nr:proton-conducting transporter membrane subunit [Rhodomicrobium vannielii]ADP70362.1 NADH/Ubiquinone/plastoquinone (complex I) [Rhodomicrobium vannielii ATCC 17100]